jgi:hypothetical protein
LLLGRQDGIGGGVSGTPGCRGERAFDAVDAEQVVAAIRGFDEAIGIEQESIAPPGIEAKLRLGIDASSANPSNTPFASIRSTAVPSCLAWSIGGCPAEAYRVRPARLSTNNGGDVLAGEAPAQGAVQAAEHRRWMVRVRLLRRERNLDHRREQRGRYAVAGHIRYQHAQPIVADVEEVIEVAGHRPSSAGTAPLHSRR